MLSMEREKKIVDLVNQKGIISVEEVASLSNISKTTAYRYINTLDDRKQLVKVRGGAKSILPVGSGSGAAAAPAYEEEPPLETKDSFFQEEKQRIAQAAQGLILPGDRIMLDSGSTTLELAKILDKDLHGTLITNDLRIAITLGAHKNLDMLFVGGMIRKGFYSSYSYFAESMLDSLVIDKLFFSVDAISPDLSLMNFTLDDITLKKNCISKAKEAILLCDHSKFSVNARFAFEKLDAVSTIIVDSGLSPDIQHRLRRLGKQLIVV